MAADLRVTLISGARDGFSCGKELTGRASDLLYLKQLSPAFMITQGKIRLMTENPYTPQIRGKIMP
jgi:hypothetical protein